MRDQADVQVRSGAVRACDPQQLSDAIAALHERGANAASIASLLALTDVPSPTGAWTEETVATVIVQSAEKRRRRVGGPGNRPVLDRELVAAIRRLHSEGASPYSLARLLNLCGVPPAKADRWRDRSVQWIVSERRS